MRDKKGSGGILRMREHTLSGMLVDFKSRDFAGVWVVLTESRGAYKEGEDYHVSEWEYEELWEGTV